MTKLLKNIGIIFGIGCAVFVIGNFFFDGFHFKDANAFLISFGYYQLYSFVLGFSNKYFFEYLEKLQWKRGTSVRRIVVGIIGSTIITVIGLFFLKGFIAMVIHGRTFSDFIAHENYKGYQFGVWITLTIVMIFHFIYFYNRYQKNKIKEQKVIAGTASAKFDALKNQLDPHFLFNSLNVLTSLIDESPESAQQFTSALSKIYRYVLEQKNKDLVTVDEELDFAKTYMTLLKMRFEDSIVFEMPDKASNPESKVVPLSLQLLLENAVKHNMVTSSRPLRIKIYEDSHGNLVVENNLQLKQIMRKGSGVGLDNIRQRYQLLTDKKVNINQQADRFAVAIPMLTKQVSFMETKHEHNEQKAYYNAKKRVEEIKRFYSNLISYCIVIPILAYVDYQTNSGFHWFWFPMLGWGIGLTLHAFRVFGYGKSWEERKIQQIMDKEHRKKTWK